MKLRCITESTNALVKLKDIYDADQKERKEYQGYLAKFSDWRVASQQWAQDKNRDQNDVFDDAHRLSIAKQIIKNNLQTIASSQQAINIAWLLVQHMDDDVPFQQWFLTQLKEGTEEHKYLTDRVAVNTGAPQQYNTQTE